MAITEQLNGRFITFLLDHNKRHLLFHTESIIVQGHARVTIHFS